MFASARGSDGPGRAAKKAAPRVESLEGRALLSGLYGSMTHASHHAAMVSARGGGDHGGEVKKAPQFYEFYVGPNRDDLNVVSARAELDPGKGLVVRGKMAGAINTSPATADENSFYVFGINRGSSKAIAPFFARPGVVFDAVVVVSVTNTQGITASVRDFATGVGTNLPASAVRIHGKEVKVTVDPSLLPAPAGGVSLSHSTFNLWPRSSLANPVQPTPQSHDSFVASFIPENAMAPIHAPGHRG